MASLGKVAAVNGNAAMNSAPLPAPRVGDGVGNRVNRAEHERRLYFVTEKMIDGLSRRTLVELAMNCFKVGRRAAYKYVAIAERRLQNQEAGVNPHFYFALTRLQRDKLLELVFRQAQRPEPLEPKVLLEMVATANKVLDSRDRAASQQLEARAAEDPAPAQVHVTARTLQEAPKMLREPLQLEHDTDESAPPDQDVDGDQGVDDGSASAEEVEPDPNSDTGEDPMSLVPPHVIGRLTQLLHQGCTPEEAVAKVLAEDGAADGDGKFRGAKQLQPADWQV